MFLFHKKTLKFNFDRLKTAPSTPIKLNTVKFNQNFKIESFSTLLLKSVEKPCDTFQPCFRNVHAISAFSH